MATNTTSSIDDKIDGLCNRHPEIKSLVENGEAVRSSSFLTDIRNKLLRFGNLTDRQIDAVRRAIEGHSQRREGEAKRAALAASGVKAPQGASIVVGQIVSVKETTYGGYAAIVDTDEGWRCWFRLPAALLRECDIALVRGRRVEFKATLTRSDRDDLFAFAKRPSSAKFLTT